MIYLKNNKIKIYFYLILDNWYSIAKLKNENIQISWFDYLANK